MPLNHFIVVRRKRSKEIKEYYHIKRTKDRKVKMCMCEVFNYSVYLFYAITTVLKNRGIEIAVGRGYKVTALRHH